MSFVVLSPHATSTHSLPLPPADNTASASAPADSSRTRRNVPRRSRNQPQPSPAPTVASASTNVSTRSRSRKSNSVGRSQNGVSPDKATQGDSGFSTPALDRTTANVDAEDVDAAGDEEGEASNSTWVPPPRSRQPSNGSATATQPRIRLTFGKKRKAVEEEPKETAQPEPDEAAPTIAQEEDPPSAPTVVQRDFAKHIAALDAGPDAERQMRWNRGLFSPDPMDIIGTMSSPESEPVRLSSLHDRKPENEANGASEFRARWDAIFDPELPFLETQAEPDGGASLGEDLSSFLPSADPAAKRRRGSTDPLTEPDDEAQAMPEQGAENGAEGPEVGVEHGVEHGVEIAAENGMENGVENGTPAPEELTGKRAPRKKRKWLKKGEIDPDDTQAVARQRERHEMIDQAIANLDMQYQMVEDETHIQLLQLWEELDRRRDVQFERLDARQQAVLKELTIVANHEERSHIETWDFTRDKIRRDLVQSIAAKKRKLDGEKAMFKRQPTDYPLSRAGPGGGGWKIYDEHLMSEKNTPLVPTFLGGKVRQRRDLSSRPSLLDPASIAEDLVIYDVRQPKKVKSSEGSAPQPAASSSSANPPSGWKNPVAPSSNWSGSTAAPKPAPQHSSGMPSSSHGGGPPSVAQYPPGSRRDDRPQPLPPTSREIQHAAGRHRYHGEYHPGNSSSSAGYMRPPAPPGQSSSSRPSTTLAQLPPRAPVPSGSALGASRNGLPTHADRTSHAPVGTRWNSSVPPVPTWEQRHGSQPPSSQQTRPQQNGAPPSSQTPQQPPSSHAPRTMHGWTPYGDRSGSTGRRESGSGDHPSGFGYPGSSATPERQLDPRRPESHSNTPSGPPHLAQHPGSASSRPQLAHGNSGPPLPAQPQSQPPPNRAPRPLHGEPPYNDRNGSSGRRMSTTDRPGGYAFLPPAASSASGMPSHAYYPPRTDPAPPGRSAHQRTPDDHRPRAQTAGLVSGPEMYTPSRHLEGVWTSRTDFGDRADRRQLPVHEAPRPPVMGTPPPLQQVPQPSSTGGAPPQVALGGPSRPGGSSTLPQTATAVTPGASGEGSQAGPSGGSGAMAGR